MPTAKGFSHSRDNSHPRVTQGLRTGPPLLPDLPDLRRGHSSAGCLLPEGATRPGACALCLSLLVIYVVLWTSSALGVLDLYLLLVPR